MPSAPKKLTLQGCPVWTYDIEVFPNLFMASFTDGEEWRTFIEMSTPDEHGHVVVCNFPWMQQWLKDKVLAGFNNFGYDDIIMKRICSTPDVTTKMIYGWSQGIIEGREGIHADSNFRTQYEDTPWKLSIDVWQMLNKKGSLKEWECREGADLVAETPFDFTKGVPFDAIPQINEYNKNDVKETRRLLLKYWHLVTLRENLNKQYNLGDRIYVLSEAGIAQNVMTTLHRKRTGVNTGDLRKMAKCTEDNKVRKWPMSKIISRRVAFNSDEYVKFLLHFQSCNLIGDAKGTTWKISNATYDAPVRLGKKDYQFGVGGLHSVDAPGIFRSTENFAILDLDVASYYPSLMIVEKLFPSHMGKDFIRDFTAIRDQRLASKHAGDMDTSNALKIILNSTFGKYNDAYSPIRTIPGALRVTINGQLEILMLVEALAAHGARILSANTDGVTVKWDRVLMKASLKNIIHNWQEATGHELETAEYTTYARRDINNYIAIKTDGKTKYKGIFDPSPKTGKWDGVCVRRAAEAYLLHNRDPAETIGKEKDFTSFLYYQRANNGGTICLERRTVGKIARWYVGKNGGQIERKNPPTQKVPWAKIPNGANAVLAMDITGHKLLGMPSDLDKAYYVREAWDLIHSVTGEVK